LKIIIIGAGEVGFNIANRLSSENKHVVVIDKNVDAVKRILLAVTDSDEVNLVSCLMANLLSPQIKKLARIRNSDFDLFHDRFKTNNPHIDTIINPEIEVVNTIQKLMKLPGAVDVGTFVDGKVKYVGIRIENKSPIAGIRLIDLHQTEWENRLA